MPAVKEKVKEKLIFHGTPEHEQHLKDEYPEIFQIYDVEVHFARGEPWAEVDGLIGRGWHEIYFRFG